MFIQYPFKRKEVPYISDEEWLKAIDKKMGGPPLNPDDFKDVVKNFDKHMSEPDEPNPYE